MAIFVAMLLGLALFRFLEVMSVGFIAGVENVGDVDKHPKNHDGRIEKGILKGGFGGNWSFRNHGVYQGLLKSFRNFILTGIGAEPKGQLCDSGARRIRDYRLDFPI